MNHTRSRRWGREKNVSIQIRVDCLGQINTVHANGKSIFDDKLETSDEGTDHFVQLQTRPAKSLIPKHRKTKAQIQRPLCVNIYLEWKYQSVARVCIGISFDKQNDRAHSHSFPSRVDVIAVRRATYLIIIGDKRTPLHLVALDLVKHRVWCIGGSEIFGSKNVILCRLRSAISVWARTTQILIFPFLLWVLRVCTSHSVSLSMKFTFICALNTYVCRRMYTYSWAHIAP